MTYALYPFLQQNHNLSSFSHVKQSMLAGNLK